MGTPNSALATRASRGGAPGGPMTWKHSTSSLAIAACGAALLVSTIGALGAQEPAAPAGQAAAPQGGRGGRGGGRGGAVAGSLFTASDINKDGSVSRDELKAAFEKWFADADAAKTGSITQEQLVAGLALAFPAPAIPAGRGAQNQTPNAPDVDAMMKALPDAAPVKPKQPRKVLVLGKAQGFVHSSIPLAARTVEELGKKTGAWSTTVTYDPADITAQNLKQYDVVFLDSTTGAFLDDPNDQAATDARRKALLDFVRGGKWLA